MFIISQMLNMFAGVHDSFWTHACDVDQMNQILRENFVELYSKPILENVSEYDSFFHIKFCPVRLFLLLALKQLGRE